MWVERDKAESKMRPRSQSGNSYCNRELGEEEKVLGLVRRDKKLLYSCLISNI